MPTQILYYYQMNRLYKNFLSKSQNPQNEKSTQKVNQQVRNIMQTSPGQNSHKRVTFRESPQRKPILKNHRPHAHIQDQYDPQQEQFNSFIQTFKNFDTRIQVKDQFIKKWNQFQKLSSKHIKMVGFDLTALDDIGRRVLKDGLFIKKYCQIISRQQKAFNNFTGKKYYKQFKDTIQTNLESFKQFFQVFFQVNKSTQAEKKLNFSTKSSQPEQMKDMDIDQLKKSNKSVHKTILRFDDEQERIANTVHKYEQLKNQQLMKKTQHAEQKINLLSPKESKKYIIQHAVQKSNDKPIKRVLVTNSDEQDQPKIVQRKQRKPGQIVTKKVFEKKVPLVLDEYEQYLVDFFEINDIFRLSEIEIEGIIDEIDKKYIIIAAKVKEREKNSDIIAIGLIGYKRNLKNCQEKHNDKTLKQIEKKYENLCYVDVDGMKSDQIWGYMEQLDN